MVIEILLDNLKRLDKHTKGYSYGGKSHPEGGEGRRGSSGGGGGKPLTDPQAHWQHSILQLLSHRLHRLLKYSARAHELLHCIKYSVSHLEHRQTYRDVETFAIHIMVAFFFLFQYSNVITLFFQIYLFVQFYLLR